MKKIIILFFLLLLGGCSNSFIPTGSDQKTQIELPQDAPTKCLEKGDEKWVTGYVGGIILLRFEDNISTEQANKILSDSGFSEIIEYNRLATNGGAFWKKEWVGKNSKKTYEEANKIADFFEKSEDNINWADARGSDNPANTTIIIFSTKEDIILEDFKKLALKYNFDDWDIHNNIKNVLPLQLQVKKGDEFKWRCYFDQEKFKGIVDYVHVNEFLQVN
ncbi:hypothetical protein KJ785_02845 [Patescibacteria group bacterium]|nr:hypothetical protein [Patescibacteria group bacterium]